MCSTITALFYANKANISKADKYFNRAVEQPYYYLISASYENAAFCSLKSGDPEKAAYYFKRAVDHDPTRLRSLLQLAKLEIERGDYTEARIKLMAFHQRYGYQKASLQLLIELEEKAGNRALEKKYQQALDALSPS